MRLIILIRAEKHSGAISAERLLQFLTYLLSGVYLLVADEPDDPERAVHLVSVQQGSNCTVLVRNTVQGQSPCPCFLLLSEAQAQIDLNETCSWRSRQPHSVWHSVESVERGGVISVSIQDHFTFSAAETIAES